MTMNEKKVQSIQKEIEKLTNSLNRYKGLLEKKIAKCEKLNCNWTKEEMFEKREAGEINQKQWEAWFDKNLAEGNAEDTERRINNAIKRLEKATTIYEKENERNEADQAFKDRANGIESEWNKLTKAERMAKYEKWLREFKAECLKDGIIIDEVNSIYISGKTPGDKSFILYNNNGWTDRSRHCYTLRIDGIVYFTSGTFQTCYRYIKNR